MTTTLLPDLGDIARVEYREAFARAVAEGIKAPLVLPYSLLGPFILPPVYLAIPHTKRPWLYRSRWLIVAFVIVFDLNMIRSMSSMNVACAYASGLMGVWGILSTLNLLVWSHPQLDYARAIKVKTKQQHMNGAPKDHLNDTNGSSRELRLRRRNQGAVATTPSDEAGGPQEHKSLEDSGCVWQTFPEHGSFSERLNWTFDLATNFRKIGWSCSISSVPRPDIPDNIRDGDSVSLNNMPVVSRSGYQRSLTQAEFVWKRVRYVAIMYVLLDCGAVFMVKDPFFVYGPDHGLDLPVFLQRLPPRLLLKYREVSTLAGIYAAIEAIFNLHDLFQYYIFSYQYPARGELWQYTSIFGSFTQVFDRGLAGWWGAWWHQTFRLQFVAPANYLVKQGYLDKTSLLTPIITMYVSFFQSGLLHAAGSISCMRTTMVWRSPVFFLLQPPGIIIQHLLNMAIDAIFPNTPRRLRQAFNLVSSLAWLHLTAPPFVNDIASTGLWLLEPVPISPLRWLGFGHPDDHWWRWNRELFPVWHSDKNWWKSGLQM
ncbi:hypothetical protein NM208_g11339 [Fusarium decemcellulare]|uniref:Uncharacterized protein n=1 Tax=Fusarium decemcellulare TaxID=57161 RepID=A0ACC1RUA2_9HYPO|nr:hypothetical protein NM208_g11339 [Fusarium decemcellulare]